ncbi:MAG: hypothetical protein LBK18_07370 [Prevotellaceae bacterium]|jgi:hypothetical protein|nr:hypothetical protein [Prevotellaceae bacterium]
MENAAAYEKEADKVMDFICETRDGKYTAEKPDLTQITYTRMEIHDNDAANIFNDCFEEVILYGMSY